MQIRFSEYVAISIYHYAGPQNVTVKFDLRELVRTYIGYVRVNYVYIIQNELFIITDIFAGSVNNYIHLCACGVCTVRV